MLFKYVKEKQNKDNKIFTLENKHKSHITKFENDRKNINKLNEKLNKYKEELSNLNKISNEEKDYENGEHELAHHVDNFPVVKVRRVVVREKAKVLDLGFRSLFRPFHFKFCVGRGGDRPPARSLDVSHSVGSGAAPGGGRKGD